MQHQQPIQLLNKKVKNHCIYYKFLMNNGSYISEPMYQLNPQMLQLVHQYELQQHKKQKVQNKIQQKLQSNTVEPNIIYDNELEIYQYRTPKQKSHQVRQNQDCVINGIRRENGIIYLYTQIWEKLDVIRKKSPISVCDFLLSKVKIK